MQPHNDDQRPTEGNTDGGRDAQRSAFFTALGLALEKAIKPSDGQVHLGTVNLSASLTGAGGVDA